MELKKLLEDYFAKEVADHAEHLQIEEFIKPLEGKTPTKHRLEKLIPENWKVSHQYNKPALESPTGIKHNLAWSETEPFTIENFRKANSPYSIGAKERAEKTEIILKDPERLKDMEQTFTAIAEHLKAISLLVDKMEIEKMDSFNNPAHYQIFDALGVDTRILQDIKHGKR